MPTDPVRVAVVGAGNMGRHHVRNYDALDGAALLAVVDHDESRAERAASGLGVRTYPDVDELLRSEPDLEAVSVAVPTRMHGTVAGALLRAGKHVLVEKPIAASGSEADELIELAREAQVLLAVGHVERFNPAVRELKRQVEAGRMGEVLSMVSRRVGVMPPQITDADVIVDLAVHDIDIFRYLLSADWPDELYCNAGKAIAEDRFDFADIFLRFGSVACFLQVNWVTPVKIRSLAVTGKEGYAEIEYVTQRLAYYKARPVREALSFAEVERYSEEAPEIVEFEHREPLAVELEEFLRAVRGESAEIVSGAEAKASIEIAVEAAAAAGRR
jgi:UDP-N-acetylglucosamine 3-dehydrogenase